MKGGVYRMLTSVQPFTAERMADADERGLQTAGR